MKVAIIICRFYPYRGGMAKVALEQARGLAELGHEVTIFTPNFYEFSIDNSFNFEICRLSTFFKVGNAAFLPQLYFKLRSYDAVILHYPFFGVHEWLWFLGKRLKIFLYFHMDFLPSSWWQQLIFSLSRLSKKMLFKRCQRIFVSSFDYLQESFFRSEFKNKPYKFCEIPLGCEIKNLEKLKTDRPRSHQRFVLFVGGLDRAHHFKGLSQLLVAFSRLKNVDVRLKIVGTGNMKFYFMKQAQDLNIAKRVDFLGNVSDQELAGLYQETEFLVLPSVTRAEAFGLVLLEAMAYGKAIIASNLPGVRTVCRDQENGLLIKPGDIDDLREKIDYLLTMPNLMQNLGARGRILTETTYNWPNHVQQLASCLNKDFNYE